MKLVIRTVYGVDTASFASFCNKKLKQPHPRFLMARHAKGMHRRRHFSEVCNDSPIGQDFYSTVS